MTYFIFGLTARVVPHRIVFYIILSCIIEPHSPHWRRRGWLTVIAGVHVLAFIGWQPPQLPLVTPVMARVAITYILAPLPSKPPQQPLTPPIERPARLSAKTAQSAPSQVQLRPIIRPPLDQQPEPAPPQAITQTGQAPDPFALPAKPQLDLMQRSIAAAAAADKAVLKESFTQRDRKLVNDETALAVAIGKAYRGGKGTVDMIGADGSRITKFVLPGGGEVCYKAASAPFGDSSRVVVSNCPK